MNKKDVEGWAVPDFTKPGIATAGPEHRTWFPRLDRVLKRRGVAGEQFILELSLPEECSTRYGCAREVTLGITLPDEASTIHFDVQWFAKPACRLPEALWFSFCPILKRSRGWMMDKMGESISPYDVIRNGNRKLHAVGRGVFYDGTDGHLALETMDAPLVAPGEPSLLNFNNRQPALIRGMHFLLYDNLFGTNFPQWYDDNARFHFDVRFAQHRQPQAQCPMRQDPARSAATDS